MYKKPCCSISSGSDQNGDTGSQPLDIVGTRKNSETGEIIYIRDPETGENIFLSGTHGENSRAQKAESRMPCVLSFDRNESNSVTPVFYGFGIGKK